MLALFATALLAGCGATTKTVSVSSAPAPAATSTSTSASASTNTSTTVSPRTATPNTSTSSATTRTASAPAFTSQSTSAGTGADTATAAVAVVRAHGYTPDDPSQYHANQTLGVLVGTRSPSGDGYGQQAFFFVDGRYLGTDSTQPSAKLRVLSQSDTQVTLAYPLYRSHDALCCPSGGEARVTFELNNGKLAPLQQIPPASSQTGLSRQ
jgi:hypothetical protein